MDRTSEPDRRLWTDFEVDRAYPKVTWEAVPGAKGYLVRGDGSVTAIMPDGSTRKVISEESANEG